jgi:hypothetical protein
MNPLEAGFKEHFIDLLSIALFRYGNLDGFTSFERKQPVFDPYRLALFADDIVYLGSFKRVEVGDSVKLA